MPFAFIIPAAATLIGAKMSSGAAKSAASTSAASADKATELQQRMYEEGVARQQPFLQGGTEDYNRLRALVSGGPGGAQQFLTMDPGYGFRLSEGLKALDRQAAARGGLISGSALKAAQRYGQDVASQEFGNAYNRLAGLAQIGPSAAGVMNTLGQNYANAAGNIMVGQGQTAANAALARGSAYTGAANQLSYLFGRQPRYQSPAPVETATPSGPYDWYGQALDEAYSPSDVRLKTNIARVGTRPDGLGVYEFDYIWGGPRQRGLMAHEVHDVYPDAVAVSDDGFLMVNYAKV